MSVSEKRKSLDPEKDFENINSLRVTGMQSAWQEKMVRIDTLRPHPGQGIFAVQDSALDLLVEDVRAHGLRNPILILSDGMILSGHKRVAAFQRLGYSEIPARVLAGDPEDMNMIFVRENTLRMQITLSVRKRIYETYFPKILQARVEKDELERVASWIGISVQTLSRDLRKIRQEGDASIDGVRQAWQKVQEGMRINIIDCGTSGMVVQACGKKLRHECGPGKLTTVLQESRRQAMLAYRFARKRSPEIAIRNVQMGTELRDLRKEYGLTQKKAAELLGTSQSFYSECESGAYPIPEEWLLTLKEILQESDYGKIGLVQ